MVDFPWLRSFKFRANLFLNRLGRAIIFGLMSKARKRRYLFLRERVEVRKKYYPAGPFGLGATYGYTSDYLLKPWKAIRANG